MSTMLILEICFIALLLVTVKVVALPKCKGWVGERLVAGVLRKLDPRQYRVLNDIYLPLPDGTTTQIDHIVVSQFGVFVIETKTYKGWIFGDANSKVWTQSFPSRRRGGNKFTFQNPIRQNYSHLCAIEGCTGVPKDVMRPVIAFSGAATFKTERPAGVCYFGGVVKYIRSFATPIIQCDQVNEIVDAILGWQATLTKKQVASHVKNLKARHEGVGASDPAPRCPRCGAPMVLRTRKADGKSFYGCSGYPKCKGIVNVEK